MTTNAIQPSVAALTFEEHALTDTTRRLIFEKAVPCIDRAIRKAELGSESSAIFGDELSATVRLMRNQSRRFIGYAVYLTGSKLVTRYYCASGLSEALLAGLDSKRALRWATSSSAANHVKDMDESAADSDELFDGILKAFGTTRLKYEMGRDKDRLNALLKEFGMTPLATK